MLPLSSRAEAWNVNRVAHVVTCPDREALPLCREFTVSTVYLPHIGLWGIVSWYTVYMNTSSTSHNMSRACLRWTSVDISPICCCVTEGKFIEMFNTNTLDSSLKVNNLSLHPNLPCANELKTIRCLWQIRHCYVQVVSAFYFSMFFMVQWTWVQTIHVTTMLHLTMVMINIM